MGLRRRSCGKKERGMERGRERGTDGWRIEKGRERRTKIPGPN